MADTCPVCNAPEVEASTPRTVYECGSSDYDRRPPTFVGPCAEKVGDGIVADMDSRDVLMALSSLANRMRRRNDKRQYGVNCAWHVIDQLSRGVSLEDALDSMVEDIGE